MHGRIEQKLAKNPEYDFPRAELERLCLHYRVRRLESFGSVVGERFDVEPRHTRGRS